MMVAYNGDDLRELELYNLIADYISDKLRALEDEGMTQQLLLDDMLSDLLANDVGKVEASQIPPLRVGDVTTHKQGCPTPPSYDYNHPGPLPATLTTGIPIHSLHMNNESHNDLFLQVSLNFIPCFAHPGTNIFTHLVFRL